MVQKCLTLFGLCSISLAFYTVGPDIITAAIYYEKRSEQDAQSNRKTGDLFHIKNWGLSIFC
jgi:hypothetical protein